MQREKFEYIIILMDCISAILESMGIIYPIICVAHATEPSQTDLKWIIRVSTGIYILNIKYN